MNKKGFTLMELLCVIAILAIVTTIASASIINIARKSKTNLYCAKLELIESSAKSYAVSHEKELNNSNTYYEEYKSIEITIDDLVKSGNLSPDKDDLVLNPQNDEAMNNKKVVLYLKNNQVYVHIDGDNVC